MAIDFVNQNKRPELAKKVKTKKRRLLLKIILGIIIVIVILAGLIFAFNYSTVKDLYQTALKAKTNLLDAQKSVEDQDFAKATSDLKEANKNFKASGELTGKLWELKLIPYARRQMTAVENIIIVGTQLSSALSKVTQLGDDIFSIIKSDEETSFGQIDESQKEQILEKLYQAPPDLQGIKSEIDLASIAVKQIPQKWLLGPIKEAADPIKENFDHVKTLVDRAVPIIQVLPSLAGYPDQKTYLFLLENNAELRPTGGFIGTYGIIKVKNAEMKYFKTDNIYNLDNPAQSYLNVEPPAPYAKYMASSQWLMRDSNWSPDFPEAAQKALWFYDQENGPEKEIDGVIAVTPKFIESLIELVGSVEADGMIFTPENFVDVIQYEVEQAFWRKGITEEERKAIIGKIGAKLIDKILALPKDKWQNLWAVFIEDITSKQILFYFEDPESQQIAIEQNWAGDIREMTGDYLFVVDCNLASLKTDPGVKRTISYSVKEENGEWLADLSINYKNEGLFSWKNTRYRTYTRIIVPKGSQLLEDYGVMANDKLHGGGEGQVDVFDEWDKTVFGGFISIEPQEEGTLHFKYKLPPSVGQNSYSLYIQKQAGTEAHALNLRIEAGEAITETEGIDNIQKESDNILIWQGELNQDYFLETHN